MNTSDSQIVVARFYDAINRLITQKVIRGKKTFTERYNINRWNFLTCEKDHSSNIFQVAWLCYLVNDYKVTPQWLLTGQGDFFAKGWDVESVRKMHQKPSKSCQKLQNVCNLKNGTL